MNTKFLVAATLAASFASGLALAGEANQPLNGAQAVAARGDAPLDMNHYNVFERGNAAASLTRAQVVAAIPAKSAGSPDSDSYSAFGTQASQSSTVSKAQVKAELGQALADGAVQRGDAEYAQAGNHHNVQMQAE